MACGMTVAPSMPAASMTLSVAVEARERAVEHRHRVDAADGDVVDEADEDDPEQPVITISKCRCPARLSASRAKATTAVMVPPTSSGRSKSSLSASAPPTTSARSVAIGDQLRLCPQPLHDRAGEVLAAQRREAQARRDAGLGGEVLDEHRHDVADHDHPHQQVAVARPGRDVGREVARVDVGHGGHERRAQERPDASGTGGASPRRRHSGDASGERRTLGLEHVSPRSAPGRARGRRGDGRRRA